MTATSSYQVPVGLRSVTLFALDANGYPSVTTAGSSGCYQGTDFAGPRAFDLTVPEPRKITHTGGDRVIGVDFLPPLESSSGTLTAGRLDYDVIALLTGVKNSTVGESVGVAYGTDKQGSEPQVGVLMYQQSLSLPSGEQSWRALIMPKAKAIPLPPGMNDNPAEVRFVTAPAIVQNHLWGAALTTALDGATSAQVIDRSFEYKPKLIAFKGNGTDVAFPFPAAYQAADTAKIKVWVDGVLQVLTTDYTVTTAAVTFETSSKPASNEVITILYETA